MLKRRIYYTLKPYLSWRLRNAIRKISAASIRRKNLSLWPINEAAGDKPSCWPGWPDKKQFSLVLTHDVEGPEGLAKCRRLAELEMQFGFRSCFNFIPEGDYRVTSELREWLTSNGFEVGVHDLEHDGKLYRSKHAFLKKAARINQYINNWNAAGFRSGFMLRELEWIHHLNIQYDASTFDTDPFEPQPDGAGTIFPFWIPAPSKLIRAGYVELPYTLPQDSTLFLLLRELTPEIWLRKLDWVAAKGGMAMVNVHPDYLCFDGEVPNCKTYPVRYYTELLQHVAATYPNRYLNSKPVEVAQYIKSTLGARPSSHRLAENPAFQLESDPVVLRGKRAAVLLYSDFPTDPRPRRAAQAMIDAGMEVDVFCLSETKDEPLEETVDGVNVFRVRLKRRRDRVGNYIWLYGRFITLSFIFLLRKSLTHRYDVVHVHNMPDILVFGALVPKLRGARLILDLHDPMPELMTTIFGVTEGSTKIRVLKRLEKWSLGFADSVITVNETCRRIFSSRSCSAEKISVVMNAPDESIFLQTDSIPAISERNTKNPFVVMYHGSLVERHGLDLAISAIRKIRLSIPAIQLHIFGKRTPYLTEVLSAVEKDEVDSLIHYHGPRKLEDIAKAIGRCDVGIIPNRRSVFTELNTPTRIFEYLSQGKPVIAPRAQGILDYFGPEDLIYFELGNVDELAAGILHVYREPEAVTKSIERGQIIYQNHCWTQERRRFLSVVGSLLDHSSHSTTPSTLAKKYFQGGAE